MGLLLRLLKAAGAVGRTRPAPSLGFPRRVRGGAAAFSTRPWDEAQPAIGPDVTGGDPLAGPIGAIGFDRLPIHVDWIKYGAVTDIRDQGDCGCCYCFAAGAVLEGKVYIDTKKLVKISVQQLLDGNCLRNFGCHGGLTYETFMYIKRNGGVVLDQYYPYTGTQRPPKPLTAPGVMLDGAEVWFPHRESMMKAIVAQQPVCATIGADSTYYDQLEDGVEVLDGYNYTLEEIEYLKIAHAVAVVAYGVTTKGQEVWVAKSSQGEDRFVLIARDTGRIGGAFGIANRITFPTRVSLAEVTVRSDKELGTEPRLETWPLGYKVPE